MTIQNISDSITSLLQELGVDEERQNTIVDGTLDVIIKNLTQPERNKLDGIIDEDDLATVGGGVMDRTKADLKRVGRKIKNKLKHYANEVGYTLEKFGKDLHEIK